jgi:uncharacterized protein (DUF1330 family)
MNRTPEQAAALIETDDGGPVAMVNLIKYRDKAVYEDGRDTQLTGREAYAIYGAGASEMIHKLGGHIDYSGYVIGMCVGEVEELWDSIAVANYPSLQAFLDMTSSPEWLALAIHRTAGLSGQLNIAAKTPPTA